MVIVILTLLICSNLALGRDIRARYPHPSPWAPALNPVVSYSRPSLDIANTYSKPNPQASAGFSAEFSDYRYKEGAVRRRPHSSRYQNIFSNSKVTLSSLSLKYTPYFLQNFRITVPVISALPGHPRIGIHSQGESGAIHQPPLRWSSGTFQMGTSSQHFRKYFHKLLNLTNSTKINFSTSSNL